MSSVRRASETVLFVDSTKVVESTATLQRMDQIIRPSVCATGTDNFHGRHVGTTGNVAFFDAHVEPVPVQSRGNTYPPMSIAAKKVANANHVGPCIPATYNISGETDNASYVANCNSKYDYYFWHDRVAKK